MSYTLESQLNTPEIDGLAEALTRCSSKKETLAFLRDILTVEEIEGAATRLEIARLLDSGMPYRQIAEKTGASTATVTRVNYWLHHGMGGYRHALQSLRDS